MSALDGLLGSGVILRDGSGAQVEGICTDLQVVGVATVAWDPVNLRHVIDVGALGTAVANSVWFYNGSTGTWSTAPVLTSVSAGTAPADVGALRIGNEDALYARNAAGANAELVAWGSDNLPRFSGVRMPSPATISSGSIGYVYAVSAAGQVVVASLASLGAATLSPTTVTRRTPAAVNRAFDGVTIGSKFVPHSVTTELCTIDETDWAITDASDPTITYQVASVTLTIVGQDGDSPSHHFESTYKGLIYRLTPLDTWAVKANLTHVAGLDIGSATGTISPTMSLSGAHNGDLAVSVLYNFTSDPVADWVYRVEILGGGRYAV